MARVLVTGGAGTIGGAVVRRLVRDPDWEVRVADEREVPCEECPGGALVGASQDVARVRVPEPAPG